MPWAFEVTVEPGGQGPVATRHRFKSTAPIEKTAAGGIYLRAELTTHEHADAQSARAAFDELLAGADPDTGLSYAWDRLLLSGAVVYRLHAGCLWSEKTFQRVAGRLKAAVRRPHQLASSVPVRRWLPGAASGSSGRHSGTVMAEEATYTLRRWLGPRAVAAACGLSWWQWDRITARPIPTAVIAGGGAILAFLAGFGKKVWPELEKKWAAPSVADGDWYQ